VAQSGRCCALVPAGVCVSAPSLTLGAQVVGVGLLTQMPSNNRRPERHSLQAWPLTVLLLLCDPYGMILVGIPPVVHRPCSQSPQLLVCTSLITYPGGQGIRSVEGRIRRPYQCRLVVNEGRTF